MKISEAIKIGMQGKEQCRNILWDSPFEPKKCCALGAAYIGWCNANGKKINPRITEKGIAKKFNIQQDEIEKWNDLDKLSFDEIIAKLEERGL